MRALASNQQLHTCSTGAPDVMDASCCSHVFATIYIVSHKHRTSESTHAVLVPQISWMLHVIETYLWLHIWTLLYFDLKLVYTKICKPWESNQHIVLWTLYIIFVMFVSIWRLHLEAYLAEKNRKKNGEGFALLHKTTFFFDWKNNIIFINSA
jgi:hypothetical protein